MTASAQDFDFIFGTWDVRNRKLVDVADPDCTEWAEFGAVSDVAPILGGTGHIDRMIVQAPTDGGAAFEGFTLRLFDPSTSMWSIWWSSTRVPGVLDVPVEGRFIDGRGVFKAKDTIGGRDVVVRFEWLTGEPEQPQWQQSFSYDGGTAWVINWTMQFSRREPS